MKAVTVLALLAPSAVLAEWNITKLPLGDREALCAQQEQVCINECGGVDQATKVFCNATTMGWGCGCKSKTPAFEVFNLPVVGRDCEGHAQDCLSNCDSKPSCVEQCREDWKCHTPDAPESYLEVKNAKDIPSYVAPTEKNAETAQGSDSGTGSAMANSVGYLVTLPMVVAGAAWYQL
ncbi:hypothetical protein IWQ61_008066 [Dispira simplex]|nr:hypothetical protein IWQ61_008066 [Dispira simplex]